MATSLVFLIAMLLIGVGADAGAAVLFVAFALEAHVLAIGVRGAMAESPRLRAALPFLGFLFLVLLATTLGSNVLSIEHGIDAEQTASFYATVCQVDVALLLATVFQTTSAQGHRRYEGMVAITVGSPSMSLGCALIVCGIARRTQASA